MKYYKSNTHQFKVPSDLSYIVITHGLEDWNCIQQVHSKFEPLVEITESTEQEFNRAFVTVVERLRNSIFQTGENRTEFTEGKYREIEIKPKNQ